MPLSKENMEALKKGLLLQQEALTKHLEEIRANPSKYDPEEDEKICMTLKSVVKQLTELNQEPWKKKPLYYSDYLGLEKILSAQTLESQKAGKPAHDEMLFIVVHQAFELWFKQIMHELKAVIKVMDREYIPERELGRVVHHLSRVVEIQKLLNHQIDVLETMTSLDFMDFRDFLIPASGFQSYQFRVFENTLGLSPESRIEHERQVYYAKLEKDHQEIVKRAEKTPNLLSVIERWLERIPFLSVPDEKYDFVEEYKRAVERMFDADKKTIVANSPEGSVQLLKELEKLAENKAAFFATFDENFHREQISKGAKKLSFRATQAALLIHVYQEEPMLQLPFRLLSTLVDIDEQLTTWRYRHALMVHRMIGAKVGTGGSSGYWYLKATIERGKIFKDISNLSTYLVPRESIPPIPSSIQKKLGFFTEVAKETKEQEVVEKEEKK